MELPCPRPPPLGDEGGDELSGVGKAVECASYQEEDPAEGGYWVETGLASPSNTYCVVRHMQRLNISLCIVFIPVHLLSCNLVHCIVSLELQQCWATLSLRKFPGNEAIVTEGLTYHSIHTASVLQQNGTFNSCSITHNMLMSVCTTTTWLR